MSRVWPARRWSVRRFCRDSSGLAAVEFSFIVPLMLALIFGMVEASSGVAIDRKVTMVARTLSDLVSQSATVSSTDIQNFFGLGSAIMAPYPVTPAIMTQRVTAVLIDNSGNAKVSWSFVGSVNGTSVTVGNGYPANMVITSIPPGLIVPGTELIWSEVTYNYTSNLAYFFTNTIPISDQTYTRPRQSNCVMYGSSTTC